jgi:hypothetical protein
MINDPQPPQNGRHGARGKRAIMTTISEPVLTGGKPPTGGRRHGI